MATADMTQSKQRRRVAVATFVGSTVEWYDFFIYGAAAALVLNKLYFPEFDETVGTLLAFVTFAVGWLARPLGGVIAGHYGDRLGRKKMLVLTMLCMGSATFLIGLLPTYAQIGMTASLLLLLCRIIQGLAVGGEYGGSVVMALESAPAGRRGLWASIPQAGVPFGLVLGTGSFYLVSTLPESQFMSWGWRVPFLLSAVLVVVGMMVRLRVEETSVFAQVSNAEETRRIPAVEVLRNYKGRVLLLMGAHIAPNSFFYLCATFIVAYGTNQVGFSSSQVLLAVAIAGAVAVVMIPVYAGLSDRVGRKAVYIGGLIALGVLAYPFFLLANTGNLVLLIIALVLMLSLAHAAVYGAQAAFFSELFPTSVRYSGLSLGYQVAGAIFGGPLPAIGTALVAALSGAPWLFAGYLVIAALVSIASAAALPQNTTEDVDALSKEVKPQDVSSRSTDAVDDLSTHLAVAGTDGVDSNRSTRRDT